MHNIIVEGTVKIIKTSFSVVSYIFLKIYKTAAFAYVCYFVLIKSISGSNVSSVHVLTYERLSTSIPASFVLLSSHVATKDAGIEVERL